MPVRLGRFEMPKRLTKDEATATPTYAKYVAEPFEAGYGHTVGNSLRRVLLSSLEGAALTTVKFDESLRAHHEFATIVGVVEDVTDIILNLRKILFKSQAKESRQILLLASKEGAITAADIKAGDYVASFHGRLVSRAELGEIHQKDRPLFERIVEYAIAGMIVAIVVTIGNVLTSADDLGSPAGTRFSSAIEVAAGQAMLFVLAPVGGGGENQWVPIVAAS